MMSEPQPLNTTEHLLIRLQEAIELLRDLNDGYDWDPATFAVTVIIGLLATMLAGLAIGQGFVAAGPGRLKSSHYAIGPWSATQRTRFKWEEWRFRTTVQTPIIQLFPYRSRAPTIVDCFSGCDCKVQLVDNDNHKRKREDDSEDETEDETEEKTEDENKSKDSESGLSQDDNNSSNNRPEAQVVVPLDHPGALVRCLRKITLYRPRWPFQRHTSSKSLDEYFPATWLKLLTLLELDKVELWQTECVGPDYIPTELPAAPACGSIRDVSILALMIGRARATIEIDSTTKLPFVRSPFLTFTFRDHPLLGIVGFLDTFAISHREERRDQEQSRHRRLEAVSESLNLIYARVALHGRGGYAPLAFLRSISSRHNYNAPDSKSTLRALAEYPSVNAALALQRDCFPHDQDISYENLGLNSLSQELQNKVKSGVHGNDIDPNPREKNSGSIRERSLTAWPSLFVLAMARNVTQVPRFFPASECRFKLMLQCFAAQSKLWVRGCDCDPDPDRGKRALVCQACSMATINRATSHRGPPAEVSLRIELFIGLSFRSVNTMLKAPDPNGENPSLTSWAYLGQPQAHGDASDQVKARLFFHELIQTIDSMTLASNKTREAWFETACVLCDVAADIAALRGERLHLFDNRWTWNEDEGLTTDEEKLPNRKKRWEDMKDKFRHIDRSGSRHIFPSASMPLLESVIQDWEITEALPPGIDLSGYPMADLMIYRVSLMAMLLGTAEDISFIMNNTYDRVVPIF